MTPKRSINHIQIIKNCKNVWKSKIKYFLLEDLNNLWGNKAAKTSVFFFCSYKISKGTYCIRSRIMCAANAFNKTFINWEWHHIKDQKRLCGFSMVKCKEYCEGNSLKRICTFNNVNRQQTSTADRHRKDQNLQGTKLKGPLHRKISKWTHELGWTLHSLTRLFENLLQQ